MPKATTVKPWCGRTLIHFNVTIIYNLHFIEDCCSHSDILKNIRMLLYCYSNLYKMLFILVKYF